tara:strand:+ start:724 stop:1335 length:612 start_codon:yes stop_codon:yes gene_type:complete
MIHTDPWQYMTIDSFLSPKRWEEFQALASIELNNYNENPELTPSGKWIRWVDEDILPESNKLHKMMERFREPPKNVKKIMHWTVCPPNYTMPMHCDYHARFFTAVYYISPKESYGTVLCKNDSAYNDTNLRNTPFETNEYELEVEWKQNKLFAFNNLDKAWHYYKSGNEPRIIIQSFFVDLDKVLPGKEEWDHLIDIDPLTYD